MQQPNAHDLAHDATDKLIAEAEKRIRKEYAQAVAEVEIKLDDYFRRFKIKDAAWRRMVASGEKKKEQYADWRQKQLMAGERWADLRDALARDYHNTNVIARRVVDGYRAEAYVENHAYATYEVEREAHVDTSYTLYNREAVERIIRENPELLPAPGDNMEERIAAGKDIRWQEGEMQSVILQGILQGDSLPDLSKRIAQRLGESNHNNTIRYARTAMGAAQNAGREDAFHRAEEMGIELEQEWLATHDGRTRHSHRQMDYERRHVGEMFSNGCMYPCDPDGPKDQIWNCRCTLRALIKGLEPRARKYRSEEIEGQTYEQWKADRKSRSDPITKQEDIANAMKWRTINELYRGK